MSVTYPSTGSNPVSEWQKATNNAAGIKYLNTTGFEVWRFESVGSGINNTVRCRGQLETNVGQPVEAGKMLILLKAGSGPPKPCFITLTTNTGTPIRVEIKSVGGEKNAELIALTEIVAERIVSLDGFTWSVT